jgi:hypothetical protein
MTEQSRRALLTALGGTLALAGCTQPGGPSETDDPSTATQPAGGPFARLAVEGQTLVIELSADAGVDAVNVIAPDGSEFASREVATGASRVEVQLGTAYQPGEHQIVAVSQGESMAETPFSIAPDLRIEQIGVGRNTPEKMPDGMEATKPTEAWVEVSNQGNGPVVIEKLLFLGGVPNPTTQIESASEELAVSGIFDEESGAGQVDFVPLAPGDGTLLFTSSQPFLFGGTTQPCPTTPTTEQFEVTLRSRPGGGASKQYEAEYEPVSDTEDCGVAILGES